MIQQIEALHYRALRYVSQSVQPFQVLVGPNASGKSTFLDVIAFVGDLLRVGPTKAILGDRRSGIPQRAPNPRHVFWMRKGESFQLAVELPIPEERRKLLPNGQYASCRYEISIGARPGAEQVVLLAETLWLKPGLGPEPRTTQKSLFPSPQAPPDAIVLPPGKKSPQGWKKVVSKVEESGNDYFSSETTDGTTFSSWARRNRHWRTCPRTRRNFRWRPGSSGSCSTGCSASFSTVR